MKFIALPSGLIINLEQVAYVFAPGIYGDEEPSKAGLNICFSAMAVGQRGGGSLQVRIHGEDVKVFLAIMGDEFGLKTDATLAEITKKRN